jgi:hypothetical protein
MLGRGERSYVARSFVNQLLNLQELQRQIEDIRRTEARLADPAFTLVDEDAQRSQQPVGV